MNNYLDVKKLFFYIPFSLIAVGLYRNSWLPGGKFLINKEIFIIFGISLLYLLVIFDFKTVVNTSINLFNRFNKYIFILFVLFAVSTLLYNLQEVSGIKNLVRLFDYVFFFLIFFIVLPKIIFNNPHFFKKFIEIILYTGFFTAVLGIGLLYSGIHPVPEFTGALISFIEQPNYVPFIFNLGIIATIYYIDWQKENLTPMKKYFFIFSILVQIFAMLLTLSRGAYIGLGMGILVYFVIKFKSKAMLILPFFLGLIVIIIPPFFRAKGFASFVSRLSLLIPAYVMILQDRASLLWGYGVTNTLKKFEEYNGLYNITGDLRESMLNNPHNAVVSLVLMFGVVFTAILVLLVSILLFKITMMALKVKDEKEKLFYAFLVSIISGLIFQSFFDSEIVILEFFSLQILLTFLGSMFLLLNNKKTLPIMKYIQGESN